MLKKSLGNCCERDSSPGKVEVPKKPGTEDDSGEMKPGAEDTVQIEQFALRCEAINEAVTVHLTADQGTVK